MKRTLIISITLVILHFPFGCSHDTCGDLTPQPAIKISELTAYVGSSYVANSGFLRFTQTTRRDYERAAFQIIVTDTNEWDWQVSEKIDKTFTLINACYACTPAPTPVREITSIVITTNSTIYSDGKTYESGEDLADLFMASPGKWSADFRSMEDFVSYRNRNNDGNIFRDVDSWALFQLENKPDSSINQSFTFKFEFEDATEIIVRTPVFEVDS